MGFKNFLLILQSVNPQKNQFYKQLFKKCPSSLKNIYDKQVKSYIYQLQNGAKILLPNSNQQRQQLGLHQKYVVFQLYIPIGSHWSIELGITDTNNLKKRINITTINSGKQQLKYFSYRYPLQQNAIQKGIWSFLAIDLYSFMNTFKNTVFRSLDQIVLNGNCKIRRIFTMKEWVEWEIPKGYWLNASIPQILQLIQYKQQHNSVQSNLLNNSSINNSKMLESKVIINSNMNNEFQYSAIRQTQKSFSNNYNNNSYSYQRQSKLFKLPQVNYKNKQTTPLKSSKMSEGIELSNKRTNQKSKQKDFHLLSVNKSNRSLSKPDMLIEKSKIRLNKLQSKQQEILNKLKVVDQTLGNTNAISINQSPVIKSEKIEKKDLKAKINSIRVDNIFKSDLFKSQLSQSQTQSRTKGLGSPSLLKVKKKFQEDNIFREQSYSSSYSRDSRTNFDNFNQNKNKQSFKQKKNLNNKQKHQTSQLDNRISFQNINESIDPLEESIIKRFNKQKETKKSNQPSSNINKQEMNEYSKITKRTDNSRVKQQIIQEDVWTDQQNIQNHNRPLSPIEEMIGSSHHQVPLDTQNNNKSIKPQNNLTKIKKKESKFIKENNSIQNQTIITRQGNKQVILKKHEINFQNNQLQLIYDQMVGCYYHPITNTYYEIKS